MPHITENQNSEEKKSTHSTEEAHIASEIRYRRLFESAKDGILILDAETGMIVDVNPFLINLLGYSKENFKRKAVWEIGFFKDIIQNKEKFSELQQKEYVRFEDLPLETADGRKIHVEFVSNVYLESSQKVIQCNIRDITERKHAEEILRESEEKFKVITENSADAIFLTDNTGKYVYVNTQAVNLLGYSKEEMLSFTIADISPKEKVAEYYDIFQKLYKEGKSFNEIELVKKDGKIIPTDLNAILLPNGLIYGSCRDITKRKNAFMLLHESEEKYRTVIQLAMDAIITADANGLIIAWNKGAEKIFGFTKTEAIGEKLDKIMPQTFRERHNNGMRRIEQGGEHHVIGNIVELTGLHKNGTEFPLELSLSLWEKSSKKFFTGIIRDITERKQTEKALIKAKVKAEESDRLKSAFLANMSHEIRTPMNGILGFTELLKTPKLTGEAQQEFIGIIEKSGVRMLNIINDIINISKIESGQTEISVSYTNVNEQVEDIYNFFKPEAEQKKLHFSFNNPLPADEAVIKTDNEKVYAVLTNLVKNALKFTLSGSIELGLEKTGEFIEFFVKDTGLGIPRKQEKFIFERFRQGSESLTRNYDGAGLGLAISKAYVEMLGGKIWIERIKGQGSTFRFTIPYLNGFKEKKQIQTVADEEIQPTRKLKILVVEDDETSRILLNIMIKPLSSDFFQAITGREAVEACRKNSDIDLVLMDIQMPGMNGYEATRQIREFNKEVVIIAQTAYALPGDREKAIEAGCNDYISKPVNRANLIKMIGKK